MKAIVLFVIFSFLSLAGVNGQNKDATCNYWTLQFSPGINFRHVKPVPDQDIRSIAYPFGGISTTFNSSKGLKIRASFFLEWQRYLSVSPSYKLTNLTTGFNIQMGLPLSDYFVWYSGFFYNSSNSATIMYRIPNKIQKESAPAMPDEYGWSNGIEIMLSQSLSIEADILLSYKYLLEPLFQIGFNKIIVNSRKGKKP
jgi:hypothetical protein